VLWFAIAMAFVHQQRKLSALAVELRVKTMQVQPFLEVAQPLESLILARANQHVMPVQIVLVGHFLPTTVVSVMTVVS